MTDVRREDEIVVPDTAEARAMPGSGDRRQQGDRRKYNRRAGDGQVSPPYYEAFERIARALERIEVLVGTGLGQTAGPPGDRAAQRD